jgi:hypothetical protein
VFIRLLGDDGQALFESLQADLVGLQSETRLPITFEVSKTGRYISAKTSIQVADPATERAQLDWLKRAANAMVNAFRPRLTHWGREQL